jgi:hypothetical protein
MIVFIRFLLVIFLFNLGINDSISQDLGTSNQNKELTSGKIKKHDSSYIIKYYDKIILKTNLSSETPNFIFNDKETGIFIYI